MVEPAAGSGRHPEDRDAGVEEDARGRAEPHWHQQRGRPKDCHGGGGAEGGNEDFQLSKTVPSIILASKPPWQGFIFAALPSDEQVARKNWAAANSPFLAVHFDDSRLSLVRHLCR